MEGRGAELQEVGRHHVGHGLGEDIAAHRAAPQVVEAHVVRAGELQILGSRVRLWQSRVRVPEEIQGEVRGRVAKRLVQVHAQPGLGGRHGHVEYDLTREAQHVPGKGGGGRRRHGPCLAEQSERGGAQVRWQTSRLRRQHQ